MEPYKVSRQQKTWVRYTAAPVPKETVETEVRGEVEGRGVETYGETPSWGEGWVAGVK